MNLSRASVFFLSLFIISFPVSVTLSQAFAILGSFLFLTDTIYKRQIGKLLSYPIFFMGIIVYTTLFLSYIYHIGSYKNFFDGILKGEISDFWFCLVFLACGIHARKPENLEVFKKAYFISLFILLTSGFVSMFTPFRLSPFIMNGFKVGEGERLQHFAGDLFGIHTYLPIGFMNTHLTFGGLLGLFFPGFIAYYIYKFPDRKEFKNILYSFIIFIFCIIIFYNQSRSVWLGILFTCLVMIRKWNLFLIEFLNRERLIYLFLLFGFVCLTGFYFLQKNWLVKRAISDSLSYNTTENQRYFIYRNTLNVIQDNYLFGTGPGKFYENHRIASESMVMENQELWYDLSITPRGHAHNDFLHFLAIGGIFSFLAYGIFWFINIRFFLESEDERDSVLFSGYLVFFPAGFFQCYFLDDEVALPFFAFLGIFCGRIISLSEVQREKQKILKLLQRRRTQAGHTFQVEPLSIKNALDALSFYFTRGTGSENQNKSKNSIRDAALILFLPLISIFIYIALISSKSPKNLFERKVKSGSPELTLAIQKSLKGIDSEIQPNLMGEFSQIQGCLTHYFDKKPVLRRSPYSISFTIPENFHNPPGKVLLKIISRDAFDQDKMYRVHTEKEIFSEEYALEQGNNKVILDKIFSVEESSSFPENIYFRDFQIKFINFKNPLIPGNIPHIQISNLCD